MHPSRVHACALYVIYILQVLIVKETILFKKEKIYKREKRLNFPKMTGTFS